MIRYKDKVYEDYFIDPVTAVITDKEGNVQRTHIHHGRPIFKDMPVHCIQAHTAWGYKEGYDVHHIDEDILNNALSNLDYIPKSIHAKITNLGKKHSQETIEKQRQSHLGRKYSQETREKLRQSHLGEKNPMYGEKGRQNWMNLPEEIKQKMITRLKCSWTGKQHSEESRNKMCEHNYNRLNGISEEIKKKMSIGQTGMHFYNNGSEERRSKTPLGEGWVRGRLKNESFS